MICTNDELCSPPEVCAHADDSKEQHLLTHDPTDTDNRFKKFLKRDKPLLIAIVVMVVFMNTPYLKQILYPFMIFSTWVHEMCHGLAAIITGGGIKEFYVYEDGSGLAQTYISGGSWKIGVVASAGYVGTAILGGLLLLFRRTRRGPTIGLIGIGIWMLLSCALYVRNTWGLIVLPIMAVFLMLCGWKLKAIYIGYLYSFLAATCSFNAVDNISELFQPGVGYVNGEARYSDAHIVAEQWGMTYVFWATLWLGLALVTSAIGLLFVFDGQTYKAASGQAGHLYPVNVV